VEVSLKVAQVKDSLKFVVVVHDYIIGEFCFILSPP
jgi:hypothetical protein